MDRGFGGMRRGVGLPYLGPLERRKFPTQRHLRGAVCKPKPRFACAAGIEFVRRLDGHLAHRPLCRKRAGHVGLMGPERWERVVVGRGNLVLPPIATRNPAASAATTRKPLPRAIPIRGKVNASGPTIEN